FSFFFSRSVSDLLLLHSFPTRRSSDLLFCGEAGARTIEPVWRNSRRADRQGQDALLCNLGANAPADELRYHIHCSDITGTPGKRSEEHTSELQSRGHLVCRLLLEKKNK